MGVDIQKNTMSITENAGMNQSQKTDGGFIIPTMIRLLLLSMAIKGNFYALIVWWK